MMAPELTASEAAANHPEWAIRIRGLRKRFAPGAPEVLKGVDLDIARGKVNLVIGGSGQGKSVLIKHVIGLLAPDAGAIWVDGENVVGLGEAALWSLRKKFGMVFQMAALFDSMTVWENCAFPLKEHTTKSKDEIDAIIGERLRALGLLGAEHKFPSELSGGMRKRVGLARALVLEPEIILYDEPTTGLDPIATENVDNMITTVAQTFHVTSVVISHDMASVFRTADRIAMLYGGVVAAVGTPEEIRDTDNEYVRRFITTSGVDAALGAAAGSYA